MKLADDVDLEQASIMTRSAVERPTKLH
jgi:hypothetical protein